MKIDSEFMSNGENLYFNDKEKFKYEELYCLWGTVFQFLLPRLREFRKTVPDYPYKLGSNENWKIVLDEIIWFVETTLINGHYIPYKKKERYLEAEKLFKEYFFHLWY